jgi:xanthine dehydrogenase small subunit
MPAAPRPIRFRLGEDLVEVDDVPPMTTALDWLRGPGRRLGTKEGCAEGDCGACTVVIGTPCTVVTGAPGRSERLRLEPVNACLLPLPALDGRQLYTVEDLGTAESLHPVQQALVDCHGSQCGFCTPGFVMSLWSLYEDAGAPANGSEGTAPVPGDAAGVRAAVCSRIAGNLCRCTGYRPIIDAGISALSQRRAVGAAHRPRLDHRAAAAALARWSDGGDFIYRHGDAQWIAPQSLDALVDARAADPSAVIVAGNTDTGLWVNKALRDLPRVIHTGRVAELQQIVEINGGQQAEPGTGGLWIGAAVSLERAFEVLCRNWPELGATWERFASPPIRHAGTLGGNVANGSPIGDGPPALIALDAAIELRAATGARRLAIERFFVDYRQTELRADEVVVAVVVPPRPRSARLRAYKVARRHDSDISAIYAALRVDLDGDGTVIAARLAFGGMAAIPKRAAGAEGALVGQPWSEGSVRAAMTVLAADFTPIDDHRASAVYRRRVAGNLLWRFWLETRSLQPFRPDEASVFAAATAPGAAP